MGEKRWKKNFIMKPNDPPLPRQMKQPEENQRGRSIAASGDHGSYLAEGNWMDKKSLVVSSEANPIERNSNISHSSFFARHSYAGVIRVTGILRLFHRYTRLVPLAGLPSGKNFIGEQKSSKKSGRVRSPPRGKRAMCSPRGGESNKLTLR